MLSGAIIMNEQKMYSWTELFELFLSSIVCIVGVLIIIKKNKTTVGNENDDYQSPLIQSSIWDRICKEG